MAESKQNYYTEDEKKSAIDYAVENGFPPLGLWSMPQFT